MASIRGIIYVPARMDLFDHAARPGRRRQAARRSGSAPAGSRSSSARSTCSGRAARCAGPSRPTRSPRSSSGARPGTGKTTLGAHRGRAHRRRSSCPSRAVLGGVKEIREIVAAARERQAAAPAADHPLRRRDPPLHQVPAGRLPAPRRGRHDHAHRRHHREPLLRGQRRPPLPLPGGDAAGAHRRGGGRRCSTGRWPRRSGLAGTVRALARGPRGASPAPPTATRAGRCGARGRPRPRCGWPGGRRSPPPTPRRRCSTSRCLYDKAGEEHYNVVSAPSSSRCAAPTRTPRSTTWCACWRRARSRASCCAAWSSSRARTWATPTRRRSSSPPRRCRRWSWWACPRASSP